MSHNIRIDSKKQTAAYQEIQEQLVDGINQIEHNTPFKVCAITLGTKQKATMEAAVLNKIGGNETIAQINGRPIQWLKGSWILFTCGQDQTDLTPAP